MARTYSRKKGKSASKKPSQKIKPSWVRYDAKEIEALVVKFAKTGKSASEIGMILRDTYGIPDVRSSIGKRIAKILEEHALKPKLPDDLKSLIKRDVVIIKHLETNPHDQVAKRGLQLTESKISRLVIYYKREGVLAPNFVYERDKAKAYL